MIVALGCNDLKARFSATAGDIANGAERLIQMARAEPVGPTGRRRRCCSSPRRRWRRLTRIRRDVRGRRTEKSKRLAARYRAVAERHGVGFVDAGEFIGCSDLDGIHFEADQHEILGRAMAQAARMVLD